MNKFNCRDESTKKSTRPNESMDLDRIKLYYLILPSCRIRIDYAKKKIDESPSFSLPLGGMPKP